MKMECPKCKTKIESSNEELFELKGIGHFWAYQCPACNKIIPRDEKGMELVGNFEENARRVIGKKTGMDCVIEDKKQIDLIQKTLDMIIGHTSDKTEVAEQTCYYRGRKFGIRMVK